MKLYHTSDFIDENNNTGKVIDFSEQGLFAFIPATPLSEKIASLKGYIQTTDHYIQLFTGFDFSQNPPATSVKLLPNHLHFYLVARDMNKLSFSGLNFGKRLLFLRPGANTAGYIFNKKNIQCKPCSTGNTVAAADLTGYIPVSVTLDEIRGLVQQPLGDNNHLLDLKVLAGASTITITKDEDLKNLHTALQPEVYKTMQLSFRKNSDDSLIKSFSKILIMPPDLPANVVGIVEIPLAALKTNDPVHLNYEGLNNFIVHFPAFKSSVALTVNTSQFDNNSKLFYDDHEVLNPGIADHPQINNYKQVTATISDSVAYLNKPALVVIKHGNKKNSTRVNPLNNYNPQTNTAQITITK